MTWRETVNERMMLSTEHLSFATECLGDEGGYTACIYRKDNIAGYPGEACRWGGTPEAAIKASINAFDPEATFG